MLTATEPMDMTPEERQGVAPARACRRPIPDSCRPAITFFGLPELTHSAFRPPGWPFESSIRELPC
jgi:hypothetical protein